MDVVWEVVPEEDWYPEHDYEDPYGDDWCWIEEVDGEQVVHMHQWEKISSPRSFSGIAHRCEVCWDCTD